MNTPKKEDLVMGYGGLYSPLLSVKKGVWMEVVETSPLSSFFVGTLI